MKVRYVLLMINLFTNRIKEYEICRVQRQFLLAEQCSTPILARNTKIHVSVKLSRQLNVRITEN